MPQKYAIVIEDDPKLGVIFQTALKQAGFRTSLDENGNQYRAFLETGKPDLVILDLHLPYAFGGDILKEIRAKYDDVVVAVVTADFIKAKTLTAQADHILIKPVSVASLLRIANSLEG